ncbi:MAG: methyltransferase domain-containing protein [Pseudonocardiaceae bacterium]
MTTPGVADWRVRARRLADQLTAEGDLRTASWREALVSVPRHEFVPRYYELDTGTRPATWTCHEPGDEAGTARWLERVYSPTTLVTELADYAGRGVQTGVVSSTKPDLMIRMLEALQVSDGMQVCEIGTGTGYNAALLCHRLGDTHVCSIDIDPSLIAAARTRLARLGYHPALIAADGADGSATHAPFDRIIATCAVRAIPPAWIHQLTPGGLLLVHLEGPLGAGNLLALHRGDGPVLHGRFLPWWGCFMRRRTTTGPSTGTPPPTRTTQPPTIRRTPLNPAELDGGARFPLLAQLHLPSGMFHSIRPADDQAPVSYLAAPDGSWCEITRTPDSTGQYPLREAGPTPIWAAIENAWTQWTELGAPAWHDFGLTATPATHHIWHRDPHTGPHWALPTPNETESEPGKRGR